ncbi:MAG TPA: TolC family protein [Arenibacter sp.]|nr:TolC family protein [Arenibacter sp.]
MTYAQTGYTLKEALRTAKTNNPFLKTERFEIDLSESEILSAQLRPNPVLGNETLQLARASEFPIGTHWYNGQNREVLWQLSKPFQIMGQRKYKIEVAHKNALFTQKNYREIERNLLFEVAQKWLEVWTAHNQLDIIKIAKDNVDSLVLTNRHRYKNQVITQTDLFRTELLAKQYALQHRTEKQDLINLQKELQFLIGIKDSVGIASKDDFLFTISHSIDDLLDRSLKYRSDMETARSRIDVSGSNINLQKSLAYPQPEIGLIFNTQNAIPHVGMALSIDLPFFDRNQGEIRKSQIMKDQAEQQLYTLEKQLRSEVSIAYANYRLQQGNIAEFKEVLKQSQTILDNVKYAYLREGTTIIDFLEAQRSWLETQQHYFEAMQQYRQSYIQLLYSAGLIDQLIL